MPPNTRLTIGNYIADILVDRRSYDAVYHWIVQKIGSAEIIAWSQENSCQVAKQAARECLRNLTQNMRKKAKNGNSTNDLWIAPWHSLKGRAPKIGWEALPREPSQGNKFLELADIALGVKKPHPRKKRRAA